MCSNTSKEEPFSLAEIEVRHDYQRKHSDLLSQPSDLLPQASDLLSDQRRPSAPQEVQEPYSGFFGQASVGG